MPITNTVLGQYKSQWRERVRRALQELAADTADHDIIIQNTHDPALGDIAFPLFSFAKRCAMSPPQLAARLQTMLVADRASHRWGRPQAAGGYLNIHLDRADIAARILAPETLDGDPEAIPVPDLSSQKICIEFSSPNTNKPLHLGHLRNNVLGESIARILTHCGAAVTRLNLINDRGVHICKSMAAYQRFANGALPTDAGVRPDVFVGDYYVRFSQWEEKDPQAIETARSLLRKWEANDPPTRRLWEQMRQWVLDGIGETYRRTDIHFDRYQYESETYLHGKEIVQRGLDSGVFYIADDGSIEVDLSDVNLDTKKLLRSDGTSIYVTQDLGTVVQRHREFDFDRLIYIVANEQEYHFKVLFEIIARLRLPFADRLFHRSYGVVQLPDGKMKSRQGTVVDADALIDEVRNGVRRQMEGENRYRAQRDDTQQEHIAEKIAISSIHYWLLKFDPHKNITFDTRQSISFNGNSGAYILYTIARLRHLLQQDGAQEDGAPNDAPSDAAHDAPSDAPNDAANDAHSDTPSDAPHDAALAAMPSHPLEWRLLFLIAQFPEIAATAARTLNPFLVAQYLYDVAHTFSGYYHEVPIAVERDPTIRQARVRLARKLLAVLECCCHLLVMPTVTDM